MEIMTTEFWSVLGQIIFINILLSGDNAVVIALASRSLPPAQQKKAIFFGSGAAVVLRVILTVFAVALLELPSLKLIGGVLLVYIGVKMLIPEDDDDEIEGSSNLTAAIRTILIADFVMSLDNVLGVAAAARGHVGLLIIGLATSIPIIIYGSTLMLKLMERWPIIVTAGGGLLGWVAGEMMVTDHAFGRWIVLSEGTMEILKNTVPATLAAFVIILGWWIARSMRAAAAKEGKPLEDLAQQPAEVAAQTASSIETQGQAPKA